MLGQSLVTSTEDGVFQKDRKATGGAVAISAEVPLAEMFGYVTQLRTITSGRASSSMEFSHFAPAPKGVADAVIEKAKGAKA